MVNAAVMLLALQMAAATPANVSPHDVRRELNFDVRAVNLNEWKGAVDSSLRKKADFGDPIAQMKLGVSYARGTGDVPRDPAAALSWLRRAATGGSVAAEEVLGLMYMVGDGVTRDTQAAAHWFEAAVRHGEPKACTNLAVLY